MIESIGDALSVFVTGFFVLSGLYILVLVSNKHHESYMHELEEKYYQFYDDSADGSDEDHNDPYFES